MTERAGTSFKKLNLLKQESTPNITITKKSISDMIPDQFKPRNNSFQMNSRRGQINRLFSAQNKNEQPVSASLNVKHRPTKAIDDSNKIASVTSRDNYSYLKELIPDPSNTAKQDK